DDLFKSFFDVLHFKSTLNRRYESFVGQQMLALPQEAKYKYIKCPYGFMSYDNDGLPEFETIMNGNSIVDHVTTLIQDTQKPLFVIIEAAAGFGKTCSSYELLKNINSLDGDLVPLYIELSRNREARIFKHILLNEIDNQFQNTISSEIVIREIKNGRIPLIIDGFDELLSKDLSQTDSQLRDVESMLNTIVELLENNAKIVITSRKTAIFNSEEFFEWMQDTSTNYSVARFTLSEPEIQDWLSETCLQTMKDKEFPIGEIANPVLLTYIRNLPEKEFLDLVEKSESIVDKYFEFILNRERIRQNFDFDNDTQFRILKKLVRIMSELDIKSEDKVFIKELIREYNEEVFDNYLKKCQTLPKPTKDELADTLSNHALLDRKQNDKIGIINEFVLGYLMGKNLIEGDYKRHHNNDEYRKHINQDLASLAVMSFKVQSAENKIKLYNAFTEVSFGYQVEFDLNRDISLTGKTTNRYSSGLISDTVYRGISFSSPAEFIDFNFNDCVFKRCTFRKTAFINSSFTNCTFYDCSWENSDEIEKTDISSVYLVGCNSNNDFIELNYKETPEEADVSMNVGDIEDAILGIFIKDGKRANSMKKVLNIKNELSEHDGKLVDKALSNLHKKKFIILNGGLCFIQKEAITYFRNHLQS
ncbi:MAG: hypothetical protein LBR68_05065, partial [Lachnoclostridium sp.]|nr:hypothetical protein [Lachnoclostridium sp.]